MRPWRYVTWPRRERHMFWEALRVLRREERILPQARSRLGAHPGADDREQAALVATAVRRAAQVTRSKCLARALAGQTMLQRRGLGAEVTVGAKHGPDGFQAHAWLRHDGTTLLGGPAADYAELAD